MSEIEEIAVSKILKERENKLHPTQKKILAEFSFNEMYDFTVRDWQKILGLSAVSVAYHHLEQLVKKGYLIKKKRKGIIKGKGYYRKGSRKLKSS